MTDVASCKRCPRLIKYCQKIAKEKRKSYAEWNYWGRPVPDFGDAKAGLLIVGLAPAAHGANRTGRMFTGDRSGEWLYRALYEHGFSNQETSTSDQDGLHLKNALITAVAHCAPPDNKLTVKEIENCRIWLDETFNKVPFRVILALGGLAWKEAYKQLERLNLVEEKVKFGHGAMAKIKGQRYLIGSYHPSQQNTFTGRLTKPMFDQVFQKARSYLS